MQHFLPNGQSLEIRPAVRTDASFMLAYYRKLNKETDFLLFTPRETENLDLESEREFIDSYNRTDDLLLVAVSAGQLIGSVSVRQGNVWKQGHIGQLGIGVLHEFWNMGIGRRLMTAAVRWVEQHREIEIISLNVFSTNERAIQLYRNFGFTEYGRMPQGVRQEDGSYGDTILMSKRIKE